MDDGSTDNSLAIAREYEKQHSTVKVIQHEHNRGIGEALYSGYAVASKDYVCAVPGDGQFDLNELTEVKPFGRSIYYAFYRQATNYSFYRSSLTWLNRLFNQHVLGIYLRDVNWIKVYRKEQLTWVNPQLRSSLIESEICAKLYKGNVLPKEIPSAYLQRSYGTAKGGNWKTLRLAIADMIKLWWLVYRFKNEEKEV